MTRVVSPALPPLRVLVRVHVGKRAGPPCLAGEPAPQRPSYQVLRFNEDWSVLRHIDTTAQADFFDPIKYVPLSDDGEIWASFGGQLRLRLESWSDFNFGGGRA